MALAWIESHQSLRGHPKTEALMECNYCPAMLASNVEAGVVEQEIKCRIVHSHFSLEHVKSFLCASDLSRVEEIWLLHLSDVNADAARFRREIQAVTGRIVRVAGELCTGRNAVREAE